MLTPILFQVHDLALPQGRVYLIGHQSEKSVGLGQGYVVVSRMILICLVFVIYSYEIAHWPQTPNRSMGFFVKESLWGMLKSKGDVYCGEDMDESLMRYIIVYIHMFT